ncbi:MAG: NfeD family protein, partial [Lachnospiraceae bacterium]|nr:NfeD family protein [Lachnospiraceae bacterium]
MTPFYWLIALAVFLVIEIITMGLTTIWFAGGSLVAFIAS